MRRRDLACVLIVIALSVCAGSCSSLKSDSASNLVGRWRRIGQPGISDPDVLLVEYVEFRDGGGLVTLLHDAGPDQYWMTGMGHYALLADEQIQISGSCWRGWEKENCTREYRYLLGKDTLRISDPATDGWVEYERIGEAGAGLPATLAPPAPTATPTDG